MSKRKPLNHTFWLTILSILVALLLAISLLDVMLHKNTLSTSKLDAVSELLLLPLLFAPSTLMITLQNRDVKHFRRYLAINLTITILVLGFFSWIFLGWLVSGRP